MYEWEIFDPQQSIPPTLKAGRVFSKSVAISNARTELIRLHRDTGSRSHAASVSKKCRTDSGLVVWETVWDSEFGYVPEGSLDR